MLEIKLDIFLFFLLCHASYCQRRIEGGFRVTSSKPYVVYLVKATLSERTYDYWLCSGAIVTTQFIITSAACVEDVQYLYAVAGYDKYVTNENLDDDQCTKAKKKKVVFTCVPLSYEFNFDLIEKWAHIDIGLAKVESPYDFQDTSYLEVCSYIPAKIDINYDPKYQTPDIDCIVMGWGHEKKWRTRNDSNNYNTEMLKYTPTLTIEKSKCIKEYESYPQMGPIIEQYMICTQGVGKIDDSGQPIEDDLDSSSNQTQTLLDGCVPGRRMDQQNASCYQMNDYNQNIDYMNPRREISETNKTYYNYTMHDFIKKASDERTHNYTRRNGICQNDHGGPLVTWVGSSEVLIGVASVFKIDNDFNCIGPFLHTSTQSNGGFIDCVLNQWGGKKSRRNALCDSPPNVRGFDMVENHISWKDHPAGPAENELLEAKSGPNEKLDVPPQG